MKTCLFVALSIGAVFVVLACKNESGLSEKPEATFSQLACLDLNGDGRLSDGDAADLEEVPDFNGDGDHDEDDAAFLKGVDIEVDPAVRSSEACADGRDDAPEYLVARGRFSSAEVSCDDPNDKAWLVLGVGGGNVNLNKRSDAAGIRATVDEVLERLDDEGHQTIAVVAGPAIIGTPNRHLAMEDWLTHAVRVYLERYPCLRAVMIGHSHGAVTVDVVAHRLEAEYAERITLSVDVDRVDALYDGTKDQRPAKSPVLVIYETNDGRLHGEPYDMPNAENWDASAEMGPKDGEDGGPPEPVNHTTIDNSESVTNRIADEVIERVRVTVAQSS